MLAPKKLSLRERQRLEGFTPVGKRLSGCEHIAVDRVIDRLIREGSCRHEWSMGTPCELDKNGLCSIDLRECDTYTEKGEAYRAKFEDFGEFED